MIARVNRYHPLAHGQRQQRVDVQFGDLGVVGGELADAHDGVYKRSAVGRGPAAQPRQQPGRAHLVQHLPGIGRGQGCARRKLTSASAST